MAKKTTKSGSTTSKPGGLIKRGKGKQGKGLPSVSHGKTKTVGRPKSC